MRLSGLALLLTGISSLGLTACDRWNPSDRPSGYAFHNQTYHAPPGPPAKSLGYTYSTEMNESQETVWRSIAIDLVQKMENMGITPRPVYVETLPANNAFNASLDYALREELRSRSYTLSPDPRNNFHLTYEAYPAKDEDIAGRNFNPKTPVNFVFVLNMLQAGHANGDVRIQRSLPPYGYVRDDSRREDPHPVTKRNTQ